MEIIKGIEAKDLALYLKRSKALIIADVHIGYEESLNKQGLLVPRVYFKQLMQRIEAISKNLDIEKVIINGDLKHEFGTISETEWRNTLKFLDFFRNKKIILIKGNHDKILGPIANKRNLEIVGYHIIDDILIAHGDKLLDIKKIEKENNQKIKTIIIGHEHPAISLQKVIRVEKYKCFLKGRWQRKDLIILPSLNLVNEGTDILKESLLSPYLKQTRLNNLEVYIVGNKVLHFGRIKDIKKL